MSKRKKATARHRRERLRRRAKKLEKGCSGERKLSTLSQSNDGPDMDTKFQTYVKVSEVNEELGLVLGWAIVCTENGKPYFDVQGDHIPDGSMLKAAADFMLHSRMASEMHKSADEIEKRAKKRGEVIFAWPMTAEIAKSFGVQTDRTGLMIAMQPDPGMLAKFKSGELTGFSIGGSRGKDIEVDDDE